MILTVRFRCLHVRFATGALPKALQYLPPTGFHLRQLSTKPGADYRNESNPPANTPLRFWTTVGVTSITLAIVGFAIGKAKHTKVLAATTDATSTLPLNDVGTIQHDTSAANIAAARKEIAAIVGESAINDRDDELNRHTSSEWSSYPIKPQDSPRFVVYVSSTTDVSEVVKVCHRRRIPIVAFSAGTSLEGHFANVCHGISIDLSRMNKILKIHRDNLDAIVQPGVTYDELNDALAADNLFFPPDPGPGAMIGGMVGTGCSGTNAYHYGTMREWVTNLTVVLADGTIVKTRQRPRKSSAGYDLTRLFIGSEGTLGIVTQAVVKLTTKPMNERVTVAAFNTYHDACNSVIEVVRNGIKVEAVELLGDVAMGLINETANTEKVWRESPTLFFKLSGTPSAVEDQMSIVKKISMANHAVEVDVAKDDEEAEGLWEAGKEALFGAQGLKKDPADRGWITDVAVPISHLADLVQMTADDIKASGFIGSVLGHVGDGNFHSLIFYSEQDKPLVEELVHRMVERAIEMEGTVTGEHGVGLIKRDFLEKEVGTPTVDLMRQVKRAFDPLCILNCDKVVRMKKQ